MPKLQSEDCSTRAERSLLLAAEDAFPEHKNLVLEFAHGRWQVHCRACGAEWFTLDGEKPERSEFQLLTAGTGYCVPE
jgi:hypothetical protein